MHSTRDKAVGAKPAPRVLALVTDAFGGYGGIAQYNRDFLSAIATIAGIEIEVLPRLAPCKPEPTPPAVRQHSPVANKEAYAVAALALAIRQRPSIIFNGHLYHGGLAHRLARLTGAKLVSQLHGTEIWGPVSRRHRRPLEASDLVLTVSRDTRARLLAKTDVVQEKAVVLNNTVGTHFQPGDRAAARRRFNLAGEFAVLTVARLDAREGYKGHDRIIPLISQASSRGRRIVYLIAGVGDDELRLRQLAQTCGVSESVRFLGKVPQADLPDLYRAADLFALPSTGEGFGISFLEAMACETPAIGLAAGGAPDALGDGQLGLCVREDEFAAAFFAALEEARSTERLAEAVRSRFSFDLFTAHCRRLLSVAC